VARERAVAAREQVMPHESRQANRIKPF